MVLVLAAAAAVAVTTVVAPALMAVPAAVVAMLLHQALRVLFTHLTLTLVMVQLQYLGN
jgi:hypothetical protein